MAAPKRKVKAPTQADRIDHLEQGMSQMSAGISAILDRMDAQEKTEPTEIIDTPPVPTRVVELPPQEISIGEIKLRSDLFHWMERVVAYQNSTSRPGWTIEDEINMLVKHSKKNSETAQAAAESRENTISGDHK